MPVSISVVREFWDRRPCNVRHSREPVGTRRYFEEVSLRRYTVEPHIIDFAEFWKWKGKQVLELGCGIGTDSERFARSGALVTAVDLSPESVRIAKQRFRSYNLQGNFVVADIERLSGFVAPKPFDLVYSFGVLHHTPNPGAALSQVRDFSRSGTVLKVMLYHRHSLKVLGVLARAWFRGDVDELVARESEAQRGCPITRTYTRRTARELVESHGFLVRDLSVRHVFQYRVEDYVRGRLERAWPYRSMPHSVVRWLSRAFGWHVLVTAVRVA